MSDASWRSRRDDQPQRLRVSGMLEYQTSSSGLLILTSEVTRSIEQKAAVFGSTEDTVL